MKHLRPTDRKLLACVNHLSPDGVMKMFNIKFKTLLHFCHKHRVAFDVQNVHQYTDEYRNILILYLKEDENIQGYDTLDLYRSRSSAG